MISVAEVAEIAGLKKLPPRVLSEWSTQLAHQLEQPKSAEACLRQVVKAADDPA